MYDLIILMILITLGYVAGTIAERRHYLSIRKREERQEYAKKQKEEGEYKKWVI